MLNGLTERESIERDHNPQQQTPSLVAMYVALVDDDARMIERQAMPVGTLLGFLDTDVCMVAALTDGPGVSDWTWG